MNQLEQIIGTALTKIKSVSDVDTVVGRPVDIGDGTTVVPISKMTLGFLAGGGEYGDNKSKLPDTQFAGGSGGAVTITPIGFLISKGGTVRVAAMSGTAGEQGNKLFGLAGDIIAKLTKKGGGKK